MEFNASNSRPCLPKWVRLQIDPVSGKPILLHQEAVIVLNQTGYEILGLCDGTRTVSEIIQTLENQYPGAPAILSWEVSEYLRAVSKKCFIEWS